MRDSYCVTPDRGKDGVGQGRGYSAPEQLESFHVGQIPGVLVAGESQGDDRSVDDAIDFFIEFSEPENNKKKRKILERFFNDPCDTDAVDEKGPTMGFHQSAWIFRDSQIGEELKKMDTGKCGHQSEEIGQSQVAQGLGLEPVLIVKVDHPDQRRGYYGGHIDPGSHGIMLILSQTGEIEKWRSIICDENFVFRSSGDRI